MSSSSSVRATGHRLGVAQPCCRLQPFHFFITRRGLGSGLGTKGGTGDPRGWGALCWDLSCNRFCIDAIRATYTALQTVIQLVSTRPHDCLPLKTILPAVMPDIYLS